MRHLPENPKRCRAGSRLVVVCDLGAHIDSTAELLLNRLLSRDESIECECAGSLKLGDTAGDKHGVHCQVRELQIDTHLAVAALAVDLYDLGK